MMITAVIPTRNRPLSLARTIDSLLRQTRPPDEIIVVDASDATEPITEIKGRYRSHKVVWLETPAAVCLQRNVGINAASGDWILLADDDIEFSTNYVEKLENYGKKNLAAGALAGRLLERENDSWTDQYPVKNFRQLCWRFVFQHHIWGDLNCLKPPFLAKPFFVLIKHFYESRGNSFSLAGWPLITNWQGDVSRSCFYSLGANLIKKEWLLQSPYDEVLGPQGIGDNYGVALGFPGHAPIHILACTTAYHHRAQEHRLPADRTYYCRILALHYMIKRNRHRFTPFTGAFYVWSLFGKAAFFAIKGDLKMLGKTLNAIALIVSGRNPYWIGFVNHRKMVLPE